MFDQYKKEYDDIRAPLNLKTKTLLMMKEEEAKKSNPWKAFTFTMLSLAVGCFIFFMIPKERSNIITDLKVGMTVEQVEVKDGRLYFEKDEEQDRKFGQRDDVVMKTIDKNSARQLSKEMIEPFVLEGYELSSKRYYAYVEKDTIQKVEWHYAYRNKTNELDIRYISPYREITTNSMIHGSEVAIYYSGEDKTQYDVYFNEGKGMYHISGSNMQQEMFIEDLLKILEKIK